MLQSGRCAGEALETRQLFQCDIEFNYAAFCLEVRDALKEVLIEVRVCAELQEGTLWIGI